MMGLDASLFVVSHSAMGIGFVACVLPLKRNADLWEPLQQRIDRHKSRRWSTVQLPHATCQAGHPGGAEEEGGFLSQDPYGGELWSIKGLDLAGVKQDEPGEWPGWDDSYNQAVFAFIVEHFPERDVIVFWC